MISISKALNQINTIVAKRSERIMDTYIENYKQSFKEALRAWKTEVRMLLNVPHFPGQPNISKYPQRRTGSLRRSLAYRSVIVRKNKNARTILLRSTILWGDDPRGTGEDYGETLNSGKRFRGRSFYGWKDRTYELLSKRIKQGLK